jgi:ABC-type amino acid transport substrate-binding protein
MNIVLKNHKMTIPKVAGMVVLWCFTLLYADAVARAGSVTTTKLNVGVWDAPPFFIKTMDGRWEGLSVDLWDEVASRMGVEFELKEYSSVALLLEAVARGEVDVTPAAGVSADREKHLDFSNPFCRSGHAIAVPVENAGNRWTALTDRFVLINFLKIVGLLILVWFIAGTTVWLFENQRNSEMFGGDLVKGIGHAVWWAAVTMTTVGYGDKTPKTLGGRAVAITWMFSSIALISMFTATVTTSLTVGELRGKVRGPQDLHTVRVGSLTQSGTLKNLVDRGIFVLPFADERKGLKAIVEDEIDAFVYNEAILKHLVRTEFSGRIKVLAETFGHYYISMAMPPDSPLREPLNRALLKVTAADGWSELMHRYLGKTL